MSSRDDIFSSTDFVNAVGFVTKKKRGRGCKHHRNDPSRKLVQKFLHESLVSVNVFSAATPGDVFCSGGQARDEAGSGLGPKNAARRTVICANAKEINV